MKSVLKSTAYILVNTPDMVLHNGTTQTTEKTVNPNSEYLVKLPKFLRSYEETLGYAPNQTYIGNMTPADLAAAAQPWYQNAVAAKRYGAFGEIMPQDEFLLLMQACDAFDLIRLDKEFVQATKPEFEKHPLMTSDIIERIKEGVDKDDVNHFINEEHSEPLCHKGKIVGYVRRGHDVDVNLSAHVMLENIVAKATCTLSLLHLVKNSGIDKSDIDYVIDCCEEAVGDMNQRGGGNMAKAAAEIAGLTNATGSDIRAFCAAPVHGLIQGAALVASGTYKNVIVAAGGCTAKLGMNGKDHVKKDIPILEDVLGGFAFLISADDGMNPIIDTDILGKHTVGTGSSPQNVMGSLVSAPLEKAGLVITDIDKFAAEMQNPEITKPAGAGDVPLANYKMIAALAVTKGQLEKSAIATFPMEHGMTGWAPTQGHIPSGVPYLGFCRDEILAGTTEKAMIVGKGSLFLGRMTNLFDGVSVVIKANDKAAKANKPFAEEVVPVKPQIEGTPKIAVTGVGSELGEAEVMAGAVAAAEKGADVVYIGTLTDTKVQTVHAADDDEAHAVMEKLLAEKQIDGAVTMHFPFPVGVTTIGRFTAANGKEIFIAATTGTSDTDRVRSMVKNAVYGIAAAKACGIQTPTVGILNLDGARQVEAILKQMNKRGYNITMAESTRSDGGCIMRGNDVLAGACDIIVTDSLSGNVIMKLVSAFTDGGAKETAGSGYGPGLGEGFDSIINIVSRASGAPVIANAILYCGEEAKAGVQQITANELSAAKKAGLDELTAKKQTAEKATTVKVEMPAKEVVTASISGVDTLDLEDGATELWKNSVYAETGMGCTGPIILVSEANKAKAQEILKKAGYLLQD